MLASMRSSNWPEGPTKGLPARSSSAPGPSPTSISPASGLPSANTRLVAVAASGQPSKPARAARSSASVRAAAATSCARSGRAPGGAASGAAAGGQQRAGRQRAGGSGGAAAGGGRGAGLRADAPEPPGRPGGGGKPVHRRLLQRLVGAPLDLQPQRCQRVHAALIAKPPLPRNRFRPP